MICIILFFFSVNTDERIIDYDPNDPNLVDEPYLDVENPYEGLGPGRPDSIGRALLPTAGRQSPDSIGQGKNKNDLFCFWLSFFFAFFLSYHCLYM